MAGGLKVSDPACDLAVVSAVLSSNFDFAIPSDVCFAGEIGLSGEVRPVAQTDRRIIEAARLGFKKIYVSSFSSLEGLDAELSAKLPSTPSGTSGSSESSLSSVSSGSSGTSLSSGSSVHSVSSGTSLSSGSRISGIQVIKVADVPALCRTLFKG